ncbi:MAG: glucose-6-phosphate dehydrogenase [Rhizobiales bacterium]|nr:glucose-6-phosphate dehydrogenase [Hyphomicrobiales bacterium]
MSSKIIPVEEFDYIVFGGTGDLAERKLIPALYRRLADGQIVGESRIIGAARGEMSDEEYRKFANDALNEHVGKDELDPAVVKTFLGNLYYRSIDAMSDRGWQELKDLLGDYEKVRAFYLAVGPSIFGNIAEQLHKFGMIRERSRLVIEKPIGKDLKSAEALNESVGKYFKEEQIFRIDHYLGKETVQNLMALRFANTIYEPIWNSAHIDHVQITAAETLGVEARGNYYDTAGAIRDMVQNHLLQLLCLVAMEPPPSNDANAVRDEKLKVLRSLRPITGDKVMTETVRGQYKEGASKGKAVPGYLDEIDNKTSDTETFVAIKAQIDNWRWANVPFYLRTGKRLPERVSEIIIQFKPVPHNIFSEVVGSKSANRLIIRLQPNESVQQVIMIKDPGPGGMRLRQVALDMQFEEQFDTRAPDAYERLLLDVIRGNQTLFMRRDEVAAAWEWIDPIIEAWDTHSHECEEYIAGSWGPFSSVALLAGDNRKWIQTKV